MIELRKYSNTDIVEIKSILDSSLGLNYFDCSKLTAKNCLVADNGNPVGMVFGKRTGQTVEVKTIVVRHDLRNQGIASNLLAKFIESCAISGVKRLWSPAWIDGTEIHALRLFDQFGFKPIRTITDYWMLDSVNRRYNCPTCGNPCRCSALILKKTL